MHKITPTGNPWNAVGVEGFYGGGGAGEGEQKGVTQTAAMRHVEARERRSKILAKRAHFVIRHALRTTNAL